MNEMFVLLWMFFNHVLDDYFLQGILSSMKQREWWEKNAPGSLYRYDYIVALLMHSISWSFMIMLPIVALYNFNVGHAFIVGFILNVLIHMFTDNLKANLHRINLVVDQSIHMAQIITTFIMTVILGVC